MSTELIKHLKEVTNNASVSILLAQWEFDRKLVGKALEGIVSYFPHFSSHNASHSEQILINIERILGRSIKGLSATDTWLLLESAYWHDIGMLIDSESAISSIGSENFIFFVKKIAKNPAHDLYKFAKSYDEDGWLNAFEHEQHPFAAMEKFRQLLAEWFRVKHPDRAQQIVNDPFVELGINSPRTELLPKRLYRYLGQICLAHGRSFESIMQDLPHKQTGLGTEECHPRFIACMLRLGDLFDLDDNRFCPVMQKQVGIMPKFSQTHQRKHLALREFLLDRETIKIVAECPDEDSYVETQNWFIWIRQEIQQQMADWKFIAPNRNFGLLPTIEQLEVKLNEGILLDGKPMSFGLDKENTFELFQGGNIYKSDISVYRELIQNAIDATMMRVWLERGSESNSTNKLPKNAHPFETRTQKILAEYPITIDFRKIKDDESSDESIWEFSITDQGVGISKNDLKYIQQLAGSSHNETRQKIINKMPKWMQPSGAFGIGMHSAFLLTENNLDNDQCIRIQTKSIFSHKNLEIVLYSPIGARQGACFIKDNTIESDFGNYGTRLSLITRVKRPMEFKMSDTMLSSLNNVNINSFANFLNQNFDPLFNLSSCYTEIAIILDDIMSNIAGNVPIKIELKNGWKKIQENIFSKNSNPKPIIQRWQEQETAIWSEKHQFYLTVYMPDYLCDSSRFTPEYFLDKSFFKGQLVSKYQELSSFDYFKFKIDLYGLDAKKVLTVDRNSWREEYKKQFEEDLIQAINQVLFENPSQIKTMLEGSDTKFSLFIRELGIDKKHFDLDRSNAWRQYKWDDYVSICQLLDMSSFSIINQQRNPERGCCISPNIVKNSTNEEIIIDTKALFNEERSISKNKFAISDFNSFGFKFLIKKWYEQQGDIEPSPNQGNQGIKEYTFNKVKLRDNDLIGVKKYFEQLWNKKNPYYCIERNELIKYNDFYKEFLPLSCISPFHKSIIGAKDEKSILLPFLYRYIPAVLTISTNNVEKIAAQVWEYRDEEYKNLTQSHYLFLYNQLIEKIDNLMKDDQRWESARKIEKGYQCPPEIQAYFDNP